MDEGTKKTVLIGVIGVCLVAAGAVYYSTRGPDRGIGSIDPDKTTWMLCRNPQCEHPFEMNLRKYFKYLTDNADPRVPVAPAVPCEKCGEESSYRAVKCAKCELVFERGAVLRGFSDRCPDEECGYSQTEVNRREAAAKRRGDG